VNSSSKDYYKRNRNIIQFEPECSVYNKRTSYRLKKGSFLFQNKEFQVRFDVNALGTRDDEKSLVRPDIVVLGDSSAMGWGVEQDSTFAEILEKRSKYKVLNTSVSSYGTARQLRILDELDISNCRCLIIQYCENDYIENKAYFENQKLEIMPEEKYYQIRNAYLSSKKYFPGKYLRYYFPLLVRELSRSLRGKKYVTSEKKDECDIFLNLLKEMINKVGDVPIIIFELNTYEDMDSNFITRLNDALSKSDFSNTIITVDMSKHLSDEHYFCIDGHINAKGHAVTSRILFDLIKGF